MNAADLIEQVKALPARERNEFAALYDQLEARTLTGSDIPESFWKGLRQADEGQLTDLRMEDFEEPPQ